MACFNPLLGRRTEARYASGKQVLVFRREGSGLPADLFDVPVPCGQCIGCRLEYSRQWAIRCLDEAQMHEANCYLTLTFDDGHGSDFMSLDKRTMQLFFKRLRKFFGVTGIRYYYAGEYTENFRPHYHVLLFGVDFADKRFWKFNKAGDELYISDGLSKLWPYGFHWIGAVSFESAAYVARYVMKKVRGAGDNDAFAASIKEHGLVPEFVCMSRGSKKLGTGGIGKAWFDKFSCDVFPYDRKVVRGREMKPPRFYLQLHAREHPVEVELIKESRKKLLDMSDNTAVRLAAKEEFTKCRVKSMSRSPEGI